MACRGVQGTSLRVTYNKWQILRKPEIYGQQLCQNLRLICLQARCPQIWLAIHQGLDFLPYPPGLYSSFTSQEDVRLAT